LCVANGRNFEPADHAHPEHLQSRPFSLINPEETIMADMREPAAPSIRPAIPIARPATFAQLPTIRTALPP